MTFHNIMDPGFRAHFEKRQLAPIEATPTPLATWNDCCGDDGGGVGLADGWLTVVGGNPKYGKSLLAIDMAREAMANKTHRAGRIPAFLSLEMRVEALASRLMAMMSGIPVWKLEKRGFTKERFAEVWKMIDPIANQYNFLVDDRPMYRLEMIQVAMEDLLKVGANYFVVDYLQLAALGDEQAVHKAVGGVTNWLRLFAKEHDVPVVVLSQFNRETSKDYTQTPQPQGLHGGMIIEASADQIILIDHSRFEREKGSSRTWLTLTNRHGEHGDIPVLWDYRNLQVREQNPDEEGTWPGEEK